MKKFVLMLAAALILAASCEKAEQPKADPTTYTFVDNAGNYESAVEHLRGLGYTLDGDMTDDGFTVKVNYVLKEYADGLAVKQNVVKNPAKGEEFTFTASHGAEYVTVFIDIDIRTAKQKSGMQKYIATAFVLTEGEDTQIVLDGSTYLSVSEPTK